MSWHRTNICKFIFACVRVSSMPKYNHLIAANITSAYQSKALRNWIENREFEKYESTEYELNHKKGRISNKLYKFILTDIDRQVIMKVSYINKSDKWSHKFELILKYYLRDASRKAFCCCEKAYSHSLASPEPLAYWKKRDSLTQVKSYFLYQYIDHFPVERIYEKLAKAGDMDSKKKRALIRQKIISALKSLHRHGIRHGDTEAHNILMSVGNADNLSNARVYFIDYEKSSLTKIKYPAFIRRFFDLRDVSRMKIYNTPHYDMLRIYLGNDYHTWWVWVLNFWRWGGFNPFKWLNSNTRRKRKHNK